MRDTQSDNGGYKAESNAATMTLQNKGIS